MTLLRQKKLLWFFKIQNAQVTNYRMVVPWFVNYQSILSYCKLGNGFRKRLLKPKAELKQSKAPLYYALDSSHLELFICSGPPKLKGKMSRICQGHGHQTS